jgi:peroxiredoxin
LDDQKAAETGLPTTLAEAFLEVARLEGTLNERLSAYRNHTRRIAPQVDAAYNRLVRRLNDNLSDHVGPAIGQPFPDFVLPDQDGRLVQLADLRAQGPVVVSFNRGHWCPYCRLELRALASIAHRIHDRRALVVSITPEVGSYAQTFVTDHRLPFRVLSDIDLGYALTLGLAFWIGPEVEQVYRDLGIAIAHYQGNDSHFLPAAATFIVGRDGLVAGRHVDFEFRRRMEPQRILDLLGGLD